jgi:hypothetical protein
LTSPGTAAAFGSYKQQAASPLPFWTGKQAQKQNQEAAGCGFGGFPFKSVGEMW